jgi:chemotaxis signal transduction protein
MEIREVIQQTPYLTFSVGEEEYGVSVLKVREILEYETVTRVPRAPGFVCGVINLRGRVVPVVDLALRFGVSPSPITSRSCIVIVEAELDGEPVIMGLVADAVSQVVEFLPGEIEAPPSFGTRADIAYLRGLGRAGRQFVLLLDLDRVLSVDEAGQVAALGAPALDSGEEESGPEGASRSPVIAAGLATVLVLLGLWAGAVQAQEPIQDNSFLIEEAYNQERGVVQHINTFQHQAGSGSWAYTFTQEWPLPDQRHQLSFTLPVQDLHAPKSSTLGVGDVALNYRYQVSGIGGGAVAFSPRLSLLLPTGRAREGLGTGGVGVQVNLPLSWSLGSRFVTHWNAGVTRTLRARDGYGNEAGTTAIVLGQSLVWLARPKVNLLVETVWTRAQSVAGPGITDRSDALLVSPGVRWAHDLRSGLEIVPGIAFPIGLGSSRGLRFVCVYLSFEHPFRSGRP